MEVKIVEDFLESSDFDKVTERLQYPASWRMQSSDGEDGSQQFLYLDVSEEKYFNTYIFKQIKKHLDGEYKLERIYFNGQWSGREGRLHNDQCDRTVLFYVSEYQYGWGGFTEIMTSVSQPTIIHPLQNRLLIFPGKILHKGYSFSYQKCPMRISLAFKLNTK